MQPASRQVGTSHTHESACRRSYSSTPDGVRAVLCLRVLLVFDVYTHVSTACALYLIWVFYTSRRDRTHTSSRKNRLHARLTVGPRPTTHLIHLTVRIKQFSPNLSLSDSRPTRVWCNRKKSRREERFCRHRAFRDCKAVVGPVHVLAGGIWAGRAETEDYQATLCYFPTQEIDIIGRWQRGLQR